MKGTVQSFRVYAICFSAKEGRRKKQVPIGDNPHSETETRGQ